MNSIIFEFSADESQMDKEHFHDYCEVYYQLKGQRYYFIKNNTYLVMPGDLVFIKENVLHKAFAAGEPYHERYLLYINRDYIKSNISHLDCSSLFDVFDDEIFIIRKYDQYFVETLFKNIRSIYHDKLSSDESLNILCLLLGLLAYIKGINTNFCTHSFGFANNRIFKITEYINKNYMKQLTLENVAAQFNISHYYLCKLFINNIGFTFSDYLNNTRIKEAKKLLLTTKLNITTISEKIGYTDVSYFCRIFKKTMGDSALKYRKRYLTSLSNNNAQIS